MREQHRRTLRPLVCLSPAIAIVQVKRGFGCPTLHRTSHSLYIDRVTQTLRDRKRPLSQDLVRDSVVGQLDDQDPARLTSVGPTAVWEKQAASAWVQGRANSPCSIVNAAVM